MPTNDSQLLGYQLLLIRLQWIKLIHLLTFSLQQQNKKWKNLKKLILKKQNNLKLKFFDDLKKMNIQYYQQMLNKITTISISTTFQNPGIL